MYERKLLLHVLVQWLLEKNALDKWLTFIIERRIEEEYILQLRDKDSNPKWLLVYLPHWDYAIDGRTYWQELSDEWELFINNNINNIDLFPMDSFHAPF